MKSNSIKTEVLDFKISNFNDKSVEKIILVCVGAEETPAEILEFAKGTNLKKTTKKTQKKNTLKQ